MNWSSIKKLSLQIVLLFLFWAVFYHGSNPVHVIKHPIDHIHDYSVLGTILFLIIGLNVTKNKIIWLIFAAFYFYFGFYTWYHDPTLDLWYPIFLPSKTFLLVWIPLIIFQIYGLKKWIQTWKFFIRIQLIFMAFIVMIFGVLESSKWEHQLMKIAENKANSSYSDQLLKVYETAEKITLDQSFWKKYQQQDGWIQWLEGKYLKKDLLGFEIIEFKDSIFSNLSVNIQEAFKKQVYQLGIPKNDTEGIYLEIERKSTPAVLFSEQSDHINENQLGFSSGIYVDGFLQINQGTFSFDPLLKSTQKSKVSLFQEQLTAVAVSGNRTAIILVEWPLLFIIGTRYLWFVLCLIMFLGLQILPSIPSRWKHERRLRIQLMMLLVAVFASGLFAFWTSKSLINEHNNQTWISKMQQADKFSNQLRNILENSSLKNPSTEARLNKMGKLWDIDFRILNNQKKLQYSSFFIPNGCTIVQKINEEHWVYEMNHLPVHALIYPIYIPNKNYYLEWFLFEDVSPNLYLFSGKHIHLFALLTLVLLIFSYFTGTWLIQPFEELKRQLLLLNGQKLKLFWPDQDEIGSLVDAYNETLMMVQVQALALADQEKELGWKNMAKQVAHEIRNPLTPMKLQLQLLQRIPQGPEKDQRQLKVIQTLLEQIDSLENISTEFSRFANFPEPNLKYISFNQLIEKWSSLYDAEAEICLFLKDDAVILADEDMLGRSIGNIIKNAIQAYNHNTNKIIEIHLSTNNRCTLLTIVDYAGGIPIEIQTKIFQPNFTTKNSGMGLGLAMVKRTLDLHHATITFHSKDGIGTTFELEFPLHVG